MSLPRKIFKTEQLQRQVKNYSEHCCVPLCTASAKCNGVLSFHGFPTELELRRKWLVNIRRDNFTISSHSKVCSRHFAEDQLIEPKALDGRRRLVKGAVPTQFEWNNFTAQTPRASVWEKGVSGAAGTCYSPNMATRWGICSAGKISHDFTVALKTLPHEDHQVVAVAARNLKDAQEFATKHSISRVYSSYEELARDPDIDVVYIGVIHPYHLSTCLLFTNAKKNVLCEKPLAMNTKEVKEILSSAKRNDVFLMEAIWTRFFPASVEIRRLLDQGELGEVKMVRSEFGEPLSHVPRSGLKELGGGAMLDIGIYCLQFICMVFNGEKPESIQAVGVCLETGVDETVVVTLKFSRNRMAVFSCSSGVKLPSDAIIAGTKGNIRIPDHMWCPTSLEVNGKETQYPVPEPYLPLNFLNSTGMRYEAEEVRQCLLKGLKESAVVSHADSLLLAELEDEIRRQVGVVYSQDSK